MGLFTNKKKLCPLCGGPTPRLFPLTIEGAPICRDCKDKLDIPEGTANKTLSDIRKYMIFYDGNRALRAIYQETFSFNCGGWSDKISIDMEHRLFRLRGKQGGLVLEAACLKSFRILEDRTVLFESGPQGLSRHETDTVARA